MSGLRVGAGEAMRKRCVAVVLSIFAVLAHAGPGRAGQVVVVAPELPPMFHADGTGRDALIIREALGACGHGVRFRIVPMGRHWNDYGTGAADAVAVVPPGMRLPGWESDVYAHYQNGASVLKSSGLAVGTLADLTGRRVVTFAGGTDILPGLREFADRLADLRERADQMVHSNLLFAGRVDAVLGDGLIFAEYNRQLRERVKAGQPLPFDPGQAVVFTAIFPPTPYTVVFRDERLRDDFNRCLGVLTVTGRIDDIARAAVEPYRDTVGNRYLGY